jgi:nucleotide-binding universal stress UspA family protein
MGINNGFDRYWFPFILPRREAFRLVFCSDICIMDNLLVLTDFSAPAAYAASYACTLAKQLNCKRITLYHSFTSPMAVVEAFVLVTDEEAIHQMAMEGLKDLEIKLREILPAEIAIHCKADTRGLNEISVVADEEGAGCIVMGTTGKTKMQEVLLGSGAISVCRHTDLPVVLVPDHVEIQAVQHLVFACDMKEVEKTIPAEEIKMLADELKVPLTVLSVYNEDKHLTTDTAVDSMDLHEKLSDHNPEYYNIHNENVVSGIIEFAGRHPATLVLLISKRHNFMEGLFYRSLTRRLAYVTPFPLVILREKHL